MACQKCNTLKSKGEARLGHGALIMRKYTGHLIDDIIKRIFEFEGKYVIESREDYQFISHCPICGEKLV